MGRGISRFVNESECNRLLLEESDSARSNNLLVSSRYLEFYRFVQHEVEWFCGGCTHVLTFLHSYVKDFEK